VAPSRESSGEVVKSSGTWRYVASGVRAYRYSRPIGVARGAVGAGARKNGGLIYGVSCKCTPEGKSALREDENDFLPRCMECRRGLAMRILSVCLSVRLSVCPSNACIVTKRQKDMFRFLYDTKEFSSFLRKRMVGGGNPIYLKFWVNRPPLERNRRF